MNKVTDTISSSGYHYEWSSNGTPPKPRSARPRRHPWMAYRWVALVAAIIVLSGAAAGLTTGLLIPTAHAARAEILYPITEELPTGFLREDRNLTTQLVFMRSRAVLAPAAAAEDLPLEQLEEQVTISLLDSSEIIQIEVEDSAPDTALRLVGHISQNYLELAQSNPQSNALRYVESELTAVEGVLAEKQEELDNARQQAAISDGEQVSDHLESEVSDLRNRARALRRMQDDIQIIERAEPSAELVTEPYVYGAPVSPNPLVLGAAGALTGVVVASCVVAFLLRRRIRQPDTTTASAQPSTRSTSE